MEEINGKISLSTVDKADWLMKNFKNFELMQYLEYLDLDNMINIINTRDEIQDYAYIIHDRDLDDDGQLKPPHVHLAVRLKQKRPTALKYIADWFKVEPQFINKIRAGFPKMLQYLTHKNDPKKYQYPADEVISNFDWQDEAEKGNRLEYICKSIVNGVITEYNYTEHIDAIEFIKYSRQINLAYQYRADILSKEVNRHMECIYIQGESNCGKTTYAKEIARKKGFSVFVSSSSNDVLFDYRGQECIVLDDLRGSAMGMSDLLKMLDNHTASTVKSRYRNKVVRCRLIIITSVLDINTFFSQVFEHEKEPIVQLKRRCGMHIRMNRQNMYVSVFDNFTNEYTTEVQYENPVKGMIKTAILTDDAKLKYISDLLGDDLVSLSVGEQVEPNQQFMQIKLSDECPFVK